MELGSAGALRRTFSDGVIGGSPFVRNSVSLVYRQYQGLVIALKSVLDNPTPLGSNSVQMNTNALLDSESAAAGLSWVTEKELDLASWLDEVDLELHEQMVCGPISETETLL